MINVIPEGCVKIKSAKNGQKLKAVMPNGEEIPFVTKIVVESKDGEIVSATIELFVDTRDTK